MNKSTQTTLEVRSGNAVQLIPIASIIRIEVGRDSRSRILKSCGETCSATISIARLQNQLPGFWRVNSGHLVNPEFVNCSFGAVKHDNLLLMTVGDPVPVHVQRKEQIYALMRLKLAQMPRYERETNILLNFLLRCQY
ncbi:hypothetical protein [Spirosoma horti]